MGTCQLKRESKEEYIYKRFHDFLERHDWLQASVDELKDCVIVDECPVRRYGCNNYYNGTTFFDCGTCRSFCTHMERPCVQCLDSEGNSVDYNQDYRNLQTWFCELEESEYNDPKE